MNSRTDSHTQGVHQAEPEADLLFSAEISVEAESNVAEFFSILNEWNQKYILEEDCHREGINKIEGI